MKRYLLFAGADYYPNGGALDFISACDSEDEAEELLTKVALGYLWAHLFDLTTLAIAVDWGRHYDRGIRGLTPWIR